ncbi:MAG TPA: alkaline phosphatase family protein, partial [Sumerlaeia bacterium]|nr:alkaline phosphatase family protein [Sumerlaeia bacterium]
MGNEVETEISRRRFLEGAASLALSGVALTGIPAGCARPGAGPSRRGRRRARKVLILGIDGMDAQLLPRYAAAGLMPNFKRFMDEGDFRPLRTTQPPQSPVAWSSFITGMDPGGHGIFDFVHRDPRTMAPYLSMSRVQPPERFLHLG